MSARIVTTLTCDRCGTEDETRHRSPTRIRSWMRDNGWSYTAEAYHADWTDLCPDCTAAATTPHRPNQEQT